MAAGALGHFSPIRCRLEITAWTRDAAQYRGALTRGKAGGVMAAQKFDPPGRPTRGA